MQFLTSLIPRLSVRRGTLLIGLVAGIAACSGQSCSCITPIKGGFPITQRHEGGVQTRLTAGFLKYVSDNAPTIIPNVLPGGMTTINIPKVCGGTAEICCNTTTPCQVSIDPRTITLTPAAPDKLHFAGTVIVKTLQILPVKTGVTGTCNITVDTTRSGNNWMNVSGDLQLPIDPTSKLTGMRLMNTAVDGIDNGDLNLNEPGSDFLCGTANISFVKTFVVDYFKGQVSTLLSTATDGQFCQTCMDKSDCSPFAGSCGAGKCLTMDGMKCIQSIGIEGKADVGSFLASVSPHTRATMDILEAAGGYVTTNTGLSLGVLGGAQADPHNPCVPIVDAPAAVEVGQTATFQGDVIPGTTTPYHIGIGLHQSHLTTLGYSFWDSGGLCLSVGSDRVAQLSSKTLGIVMPSLMELLHSDDAPMLLNVRPQKPPSFRLGKGTFKMDGMKKVVDDALITIGLPEFLFDLYLFIDDRYVRIATVTSNVTLPINLDTDAAGKIVIVAGDLSQAFKDLKVTNTELLSEGKTQLEGSFPTVLAAALGPLVSNIASFSLPSVAGLQINPRVFTSTDPDATGATTFLSIFAEVSPANAATATIQTQARLVSVQTPPTSVFAVNARDGRVPSVTIEVQGSKEPVEWSYAFDHGAWYPFQEASTLTLTDPGLWLQGHHVVTIRSRLVGVPSSLDPTAVDLPFIIDSETPRGDFAVEGGRFVPDATDRISPRELLRYRVSGGNFVTAEALQLPSGVAPDLLKIEVRDEAGNVAALPYHGLIVPEQPSLGCDVGPGSTPPLAVVLVGLGLLGLTLVRRRRALAKASVVALLVLPTAACHHGPGDGDRLAPTDSIGRQHDIAIHDQDIHIVAYDTNYGDLAYTKVTTDQLNLPFDWLLVDGDVPDAPTDALTPYRHGHSMPGPDVGSYASIALTSDGDPRMAYYDATAHAVKYARGPWPFESQEIEAGEDGSEIGQYAAITLDQYDKPAVAYMAVGLGNGTTGFRTELRVATADSSSPQTRADWTVAVVDTAPISCGGRCGSGKACITTPMVGGAPNTNPAISTCVVPDIAACPTACTATQACIKQVCTPVVPAPLAGGLPQGTGLFAKLTRGAAGAIALAYHDATNGQLRVALADGAGKFLPNIIDGKDPGSDYGEFASAAFDDSGHLHLAYRDAILGHLVYRSISSSGTPSGQVIVDDGLRNDGPHPVGASASIVADQDGVAILYQDQATSDLLVAEQSGTWTHDNVRATDDGSGFSSHAVSSNGVRYYSSWVFDRTATPLGRLVVDRIKNGTF